MALGRRARGILLGLGAALVCGAGVAPVAAASFDGVTKPSLVRHHPDDPCRLLAPSPSRIHAILGAGGSPPHETGLTTCLLSGGSAAATIYRYTAPEAKAVVAQFRGLYRAPKTLPLKGLGAGAALVNDSLEPFSKVSPGLWFGRGKTFVVIVGNNTSEVQLVALARAVYARLA
jgi:hypothetical protein